MNKILNSNSEKDSINIQNRIVKVFNTGLKSIPNSFGLQKKITFSVALILFLAISAIGFLSYSIAADQVVSNVIESQQGLVRQAGNSIDQVLNDINDISSLIVIDSNIQKDLTFFKPKQPIPFTGTPSIIFDSSNFIDKIMVTKSFISMVSIYGFNGLNYSVGTGHTGSTVVSLAEFQKNPLYKKAIELNGSTDFDFFNNHPLLIYDDRVPRVVMYRVIKELNNYSNIGVLLIWVNENKIRSIYQANVPLKGSLSIVDENGAVISSSQTEWIGYKPFQNHQPLLSNHSEKPRILEVNKRKMLISYSDLKTLPWKVVLLTPTDVLTKKVKTITLVILGVGFFCYILLIIFSSLITKLITNPLQKLLHSIKKVHAGDFTQQVDFSTTDEIGELGKGYNAMIGYIRDLIERVYKLQITEKEAELKALQAQINPHFLYNTLDTIFWKANKCKDPEISEMVYALSRFFRLSLNRGQDLSTVAQERELIENYLLLQQIRFKQKLSYQIDFDPQIMEIKILKLILQPFVENAIIHGIEQQENGGRILVTGELEDNWLSFKISDNGVGMPLEKVTQIISKTNSPVFTENTVSGGFAIQNVLERLELYYSSNYSLHFDSKPESGTTVTIKILKQAIDKLI